MVARVGDVNQVALDEHRLRAYELALVLTEGAELVEELALLIEDLDAIVVAVLADEDVALGIEGDVGRVDELPRPAAGGAPLAQQLTLGRVDHHALVMRV